MASTTAYSPDEIDRWLRAWALLLESTSPRLSEVRADIEHATSVLDRNSPGHLAMELRMKGSSERQIARALGVSNTQGARILRKAVEQMARYLGWEEPQTH